MTGEPSLGSLLTPAPLLRSNRRPLNAIVLPELLKPMAAVPPEKADEIERVHDRLPERARVLPARALHLGHGVPREVNLVALGEAPPRVEHHEHGEVDKHEGRLEDVEEPLVADHGGHALRVEARVSVAKARDAKVLDNAVDGADEDESH